MSGYISEFKYYGDTSQEFVEVALPQGTDPSGYMIYIYDSSGNVFASFPLGTVTDTMGGHDVYVIDAANTAGFDDGGSDPTGNFYPNDAIALVDGDGNVVQFISYWDNTVTAVEGPATGMTSTDVGTTAEGNSLQSDYGGATYYEQSSPNSGSIPACYAPGSLIETAQGPRRIEDIRPGDLLRSTDHTYHEVRWVWSGTQPLDDVDTDQKPVLIKAGALGPNQPAQDLVVSGQHRILVGAYGQLADLFQAPVMVPAKALCHLHGVRFMAGKRKITWHHVLCDDHCVIFANGLASESLLLGGMVTASMDRSQLADLSFALGKKVTNETVAPSVLPVLTVGETKRILAIHKTRNVDMQNDRFLMSA